MRDDDPFDSWLFALKWKTSGRGKFHGEQARACLDRLAALLDNATSQKPNLYESGLSEFNAPRMDPRDASRAQELYHRVVKVGGTGSKREDRGRTSINGTVKRDHAFRSVMVSGLENSLLPETHRLMPGAIHQK